jgi:hypothetical protein
MGVTHPSNFILGKEWGAAFLSFGEHLVQEQKLMPVQGVPNFPVLITSGGISMAASFLL